MVWPVPARMVLAIAVTLLMLGSDVVKASSILSFALVGGQGHQLPMLRVGQELAARGHNFTMLVSAADEITRNLLESRTFPGLKLIMFDGPPFIGSREWFTTIPRDPRQARVN